MILGRSLEDEMNKRQLLFVLGFDLLLVGELVLCMYLSYRAGEDFTLYFLKLFTPMITLTLIFGKYLRRFI